MWFYGETKDGYVELKLRDRHVKVASHRGARVRVKNVTGPKQQLQPHSCRERAAAGHSVSCLT